MINKSLRIVKTDKNQLVSWKHPGGKLLRLGSESLTDSELIAILIGSGVKGKPALKIADDLMNEFQSFEGLANQPLEKLKSIKGLKMVKIVRIAASFEIAKRIVEKVLKSND